MPPDVPRSRIVPAAAAAALAVAGCAAHNDALSVSPSDQTEARHHAGFDGGASPIQVDASSGNQLRYRAGSEPILTVNVPADWHMEGWLLASQGLGGRTYHWAKSRWLRSDGSPALLAVGYLGPGDLVIDLNGQRLSPAAGATLDVHDRPRLSLTDRSR